MTRSVNLWGAIVLSLVVASSGCKDSVVVEDGPHDASCGGIVSARNPVDFQSMSNGTKITIDLAEEHAFQQTSGLPLSFAASYEGSIGRVEIDGSVVTFTALEPGSAEILIKANDGCGGQDGMSWIIKVVDPDPTSCTGDHGQIRIVRPLPDTTVYTDETLSLSIGNVANPFFVQSDGRTLSFRYQIVSGDVGAASLSWRESGGETVVVRGNRPGRVVVAVTVDAAGCGSPLVSQFTVEIVDSCPATPNDTMDDYFPIAVGKQFIYNYDASDGNTGGTTAYGGTLTWTVQDAGPCLQGTRSYYVEESIEALRVYTSITGYVDSTVVSRERQIVFTVGDGIVIPYWNEELPRLLNVASPDTIRLTGSGASIYIPSSSGVQPPRTEVRQVRGVGIVFRSYFHHYSVAGSAGELIRLR